LGADFERADLSGADLTDADLSRANLSGAILVGAILANANLERAGLENSDLRGADLRGARVYGVSTWEIKLCDHEQLRQGLIVTPSFKPDVKVDNIEVAQFVNLLLSGTRIGPAIDALCQNGVLILGRFVPEERKRVLDALRDELRLKGYVPIVFDFTPPRRRDFTETVRLLAGISRFVIVDMTNPRSAPLELQATVPEFMLPFVPIIQAGEEPFSMFKDLYTKHSQWVLDPLEYDSGEQLVGVLQQAIIEPVVKIESEILQAREKPLRKRRAAEF
jgi:hypothetical protein